ncbi:TIGR02300 family protein [Chthonobacter rhizosphaerae]|uniref:TIGR02300 family protein n=1 Tax=Chthonobacter rhizosphaerae TaxID=2735553 RepID=UPI0015EEAD1E
MAKPELGTKRLCPSCGAKYYDLNRSPILCPRCGAPFDPHLIAKARPSAAVADEDAEDEEEDIVEAGPEFVSLEDAEDADGDDVPDIEDAEIEDDAEVDDTFLEEDEEDEGDVSDIIGDVEDEEER